MLRAEDLMDHVVGVIVTVEVTLVAVEVRRVGLLVSDHLLLGFEVVVAVGVCALYPLWRSHVGLRLEHDGLTIGLAEIVEAKRSRAN